MQLASLIGAIAFDPEIRGILVVLVGASVLLGSIFLIVSTNTGVRAGVLILLSAAFAWMFMLASLWTVYGIGYKGRDPSWMATDINYSRATPISEVPETAKLPAAEDLPDAVELLDQHPLLHALALGAENPEWTPASLTKLKTLTQPWIKIAKMDLRPVADKALVNAKELLADQPEVQKLLTERGDALQDEVHAEAAALRDQISKPTGPWCLLTESDPRRGDAVASSDAALATAEAFGKPTDTSKYIVHDVFFYGGKEPCEPIEEMSVVERSWHRVYTTLQVKNPKLLAAVTLTKTKDVTVAPGEKPPPAEVEKGASTVTVVMLRNLGNRRFIPFVIAVVALIGFVVFTTILHYRDKRAMELRAAFTGAKKS